VGVLRHAAVADVARAVTHTRTLLASGHSAPSAATSGFALGFWVLAAISAVSVVACLVLVPGTKHEQLTEQVLQP
jgi:hypothetical protein